ncbi:MAG: 30S ribosomal protein S12 methylthiotransferase RimO [Gammaproteobacteria bacterium]|nr:30S ribosomal protein S12 methylthiotransferase RimO [Gammaproteobacteria bacterium]
MSSKPARAPVSVTPPRIGFVSLGCPKALVDSERILTQLRLDGYTITNEYADANVVVVNTCGFIDSARAESLSAIGEALAENGRVIVTGCLGAEAEHIRTAHPDVLAVTGPQQYEAVVGAVHEHAPIDVVHDPFVDLLPPQGIKLTPRHYAYLKISEGCNHACSFCIIPALRGRLASRPVDDVMLEAERLVAAGVKELLVISQDTSAYGSDLRYRTAFWQGRPLKSDFVGLCRALGTLGVWVRLHYVYPYPHVDEVLPLMAEGRLLPYLDIPFQHGSPRLLKLMRRPAATEDTLERIHAWRRICPDLSLRSTFIVGFPGETDDDFEQLLAFLDAAELDRVGCFEYSPVAGAAANALPGAVPDALKAERHARFMAAQQVISRRRLARRVGRELDVLVDGRAGGRLIARSAADAPDIDGLVYVKTRRRVAPGEFLRVRVERADDYDLHAVPAGR